MDPLIIALCRVLTVALWSTGVCLATKQESCKNGWKK